MKMAGKKKKSVRKEGRKKIKKIIGKKSSKKAKVKSSKKMKKGAGKKISKKAKVKSCKKMKKGVGKKVFRKLWKKALKDRARKKVLKRKKTERVSIGIKGFDKLIQGGFEKNSANLVVGGSGLGKTIFATQFLIDGLKRGENCLYVTFEEKKEQFYDNMKQFGWDLEDYDKKGRFVFLEYTPIKVKTMLEEGGGSIESIILKKKISRIVIDSVTSFELLFEDELAKREAALALFGLIRDWEATALLTLEESAKGGELESKTLEFEADSIITLFFARKKGERRRRFEVVKMRGTHHTEKVYGFDIGKKGIVIGSKAIVGD